MEARQRSDFFFLSVEIQKRCKHACVARSCEAWEGVWLNYEPCILGAAARVRLAAGDMAASTGPEERTGNRC